MSHRTEVLSLTMCVALSLSLACGDDSGAVQAKPDAGPGMVNDQRPPFVTPDAGTAVGSGAEGAQCASTSDCGKDLTCVTVSQTLSVCARGCASDADCGAERCTAYTNDPADQFCVNSVREAFGRCGPADTSVCANGRTCLTYPSGDGVCVEVCVVGSDADAGVANADDAGALPDGFLECASTDTCIEGQIMQPTGVEGICGGRAKRGAECGLELGLFCDTGDICAPPDLNDLTVQTRCYQDCSERGATCDKGTCTDFRGVVAYCL